MTEVLKLQSEPSPEEVEEDAPVSTLSVEDCSKKPS
jgi:hypothetical protein